MARNGIEWRAFVSMEMNLRVPVKTANILSRCETVSFSRNVSTAWSYYIETRAVNDKGVSAALLPQVPHYYSVQAAIQVNCIAA